jgi:adenylate cyclase
MVPETLNTGILKSVEAFITRKLTEELQQSLVYHNLNHTQNVAQAVIEIASAEQLSNYEIEEILVAAWFHDIGYLKTYIGHEEESVAMAHKFLDELQLPHDRIERIKKLIIATKFGHIPENINEAVLIDADRLHVGKNDFWTQGELLRNEWSTWLERTYSETEWAGTQVEYLTHANFFCKYTQQSYNETRNKNLEKAKSLLETLQNADTNIYKLSTTLLTRILFKIQGITSIIALGLFTGFGLVSSVWGLSFETLPIGIVSGMITGLVLLTFDPLFESKIIRKFSFPVSLIIGSLALFLLFLATPALASIFLSLFQFQQNISDHPPSLYTDILNLTGISNLAWTAFLISLLLNFVKLSARIIGPVMLKNYLLGRYFKPREEDRIFMFLDLNSSTQMAESMTVSDYHKLLAQFFRDIAGPIAKSNGQIYQYVGDEVVVSWPMKDGLRDSNCIRCYIRIERQLAKVKHVYSQKFGFIPDYKVAFHGGRIMTGEVGKYKTEIVFHGMALNTCERILSLCKPLNSKVLISENLLRKLTMLPRYKPRYITSIQPKGSESELSLYTLDFV